MDGKKTLCATQYLLTRLHHMPSADQLETGVWKPVDARSRTL